MNKARFEAFSDGVFAFAITLWILGIVLPESKTRHNFGGKIFFSLLLSRFIDERENAKGKRFALAEPRVSLLPFRL